MIFMVEAIADQGWFVQKEVQTTRSIDLKTGVAQPRVL